jgi:hypothetical protein
MRADFLLEHASLHELAATGGIHMPKGIFDHRSESEKPDGQADQVRVRLRRAGRDG